MGVHKLLLAATCFLVLTPFSAELAGQQRRDPSLNGRSGGKTIYGDVRITDTDPSSSRIAKFDIVLYTEARTIVSRETVAGNGRYRFNNIPSGYYDIVIEVEGAEIARVRVDANSPLVDDIRQDLNFEWKSDFRRTTRTSTISAADRYDRNSANASLFTKAGTAIDAKDYEVAAQLLKKILTSDPKDFQARTELGNVYLLQSKYAEAETEYLHAFDLRPDYFPALLNLGRVELAQQKYDVAVEVLNRAVKLRPTSPETNYFLGESYLQLKKGSLAVGYLKEALRLDPKGMAEVHLRLALLYNAAGMRDKAAAEYEAFLKQRPDYQDRKKLEDYITTNKKP
ncbi:MAG TPA: tetratricopeptide repeat protein [Pyrinomonadaceae bacterium]